jgi:hypothetical protein
MVKTLLFVPLLLLSPVVLADDLAAGAPAAKPADAKATDTKANGGPKTISGMSILGNQEAPKSLVIVPWKSSEIGDSLGLSAMLDDSRQPVDKEVFMRELDYYQLRSSSN